MWNTIVVAIQLASAAVNSYLNKIFWGGRMRAHVRRWSELKGLIGSLRVNARYLVRRLLRRVELTFCRNIIVLSFYPCLSDTWYLYEILIQTEVFQARVDNIFNISLLEISTSHLINPLDVLEGCVVRHKHI